MRNKYDGICYYCNMLVGKYCGFIHKRDGKWKPIHSLCVHEKRGHNKQLGRRRRADGE